MLSVRSEPALVPSPPAASPPASSLSFAGLVYVAVVQSVNGT